MANINRRIAKEIVLAQIASDAGKGMANTIMEQSIAVIHAEDYGYGVKTNHIFNAIKAIDGVKKCDFLYFVTIENGMPIVYFQTKIDGENLQVSFHNPRWKWLASKAGKGRACRWDNWRNGSREACKILVQKYHLE